jgi:hypothetical protein
MSNNQNIKRRTSVVAMVGVVMAAAMLAAVTFVPVLASAQESARSDKLDERQHRSIDRPYVADERADHRPGLHLTKGAGIATDAETGKNFRSGFLGLIQKANSSEVNEHSVKRGILVIGADGERIRYQMLPETWKIEVSKEGFTFEANGQVQNEAQEKFEVKMNGYFATHTRLGNLWSIDGSMRGENTEYQLHYVAISHGLRTQAAVDGQVSG